VADITAVAVVAYAPHLDPFQNTANGTSMRTQHLLPFIALMVGTTVHANNIQVANTTLTNNTGTTALVQFDISWENSWRGGGVNNWDAAWVFVKYKLPGDGGFNHARLETTGHVAPSGSMIDLGLVSPGAAHNASTNPVVGVFVRRDADGTGSFSANGVQLLWNYGALGLSVNDITEVRVFAVEMVYMNQGAFYLGSGGTETNAFRNGTSSAPFVISSEAELYMENFPDRLWAGGAILSTILPAAFPKGFAAAYMMKYETSQQQYVDFLNSLNRVQQAARVETDLSAGVSSVTDRYVMGATSTISSSSRNGIRCNATIDPNGSITFYCDANGNSIGGEPNDGQWIVANEMSLKDVAAYLDWSGLRFMTEMEYEKACRGHLPPLPNEFPWRSATITSGPFTLDNTLTTSEGVASGYATTKGNAMYGSSANTASAVRVGAFAANPGNTGRTAAGASYYGAMELAGNAYELVISVGNVAGLGYTGVHGNGDLTSAGGHDPATWPPVTASDQFGARGGSVSTTIANVGELRVSDRTLGASANGTIHITHFGIRGIRTAP